MEPVITPFSAQLCGAVAKLPTDPDSFVMEEKFDGVRGLVVFHHDSPEVVVADGNKILEIWNRHGQNKGRLLNTPGLETQFREIATRFPAFWEGTVLDGELVASSWNTGSLNATMHLLGSAGKEESGLTFIVFDIPYFEGEDLREKPWSYRRALLEKLLAGVPSDSIIQISKLIEKSMDAVEAIWEAGGEGAVIKLIDRPYYGGGRNNWFKLKAEYTADGVITGFSKGQGKYFDTFGAVIISQYMDGKLTEVSQMSGMDDKTRRGFDPVNDVGRVIEFKHYGKTVNKRYRHPNFLKWRDSDDKLPTDCTWEASEG